MTRIRVRERQLCNAVLKMGEWLERNVGILPFFKKEQSRDVISLLFSELEQLCPDFLWNRYFLDFLSKSFWLSLSAWAQNSWRGKTTVPRHLDASEGCFRVAHLSDDSRKSGESEGRAGCAGTGWEGLGYRSSWLGLLRAKGKSLGTPADEEEGWQYGF